jgi:hypothetical protein
LASFKPESMSRGRVAFVALALAAAAACRTERGVPDPVVLELGEHVVRRSEFERHLAAVEARGGMPLSPEVKAALIEPFLEERVLALEARVRGLAREGAGAQEEQAAVEQLLADEVLSRVTVTPEEIAQHCRERLSDFDTPEMVVLRQIVVPTRTRLATSVAACCASRAASRRWPGRSRAGPKPAPGA